MGRKKEGRWIKLSEGCENGKRSRTTNGCAEGMKGGLLLKEKG